eukprot:12522649-Ditylum_brightwellii.AAC.1
MQELFLLQRLVEEVSQDTDLKKGRYWIRCDVWEDNSGALALANLQPGRRTPRSKHFGVKLHRFMSKLGKPDKGNN